MGRRATRQVDAAQTMRSKVLYPALKALALGDEKVKDPFKGRVAKDASLESLDRRVDEVFFPDLFATITDDDASAQRRWAVRLRDIAEDELNRAVSLSCLADARRYRAISNAESLFHGCLRKNFPDLFELGSQGSVA
jgi:hypothetical protein